MQILIKQAQGLLSASAKVLRCTCVIIYLYEYTTHTTYSNINKTLHGFRSHSSKTANIDREVWSGDKNRAVNYNLGSNSTVTISMGGENETDKQEAVKKVPVWMSHSTVEGAQEDSRVSYLQTLKTGFTMVQGPHIRRVQISHFCDWLCSSDSGERCEPWASCLTLLI